MTGPGFELFGRDHLTALTLIAAAGAGLVPWVRRASPRGRRVLRFVLSGALVAGMLAEPLVAARQGWLARDLLPLHLCDVAVMLAIASLVTLGLRTVEPLYFLALSGTLPALVTPELSQGFPSFRFFIYFVPHGLVVLSGLVLVLGLRRVPSRGAWRRTFVELNVYAAFIGLVNWALGTNFLYLARKPVGPTPFDWFGPWPWYILTLELAVLTVFGLLDLPLRRWRGSDRA
jgi:hypothetical integral membrane protein (TIGR02206 family)